MIAATSPEIEKRHADVIASLARKMLALTWASERDPVEVAETLVDQILTLADGETSPPSIAISDFLLQGGSTVQLEIEATLLDTLRECLGDSARPMMLNAWSAAYWFLLATYRFGSTP